MRGEITLASCAGTAVRRASAACFALLSLLSAVSDFREKSAGMKWFCWGMARPSAELLGGCSHAFRVSAGRESAT